jgi:predicted dehydrogenase/threonine dehydrogenase-like Zn-dependent dehydrogenase
MKQILQSLKDGTIALEELPMPKAGKNQIVIEVTHSLVSIGTEKMLLSFGQSNLLNKARQQPDKIKMVANKIKTDGFVPTMNSVLNKLDQPIPLGYSSVGKVIMIGEGVSCFKIGDRVVSNGPHAEIVCVNENLCAKIPENVRNESAAFTIVAAIGLQGVRLAQPTIGETFVVVGLGLIGILTAQILRANGCKVIGFDFDENKINLSKSLNIDAFKISDNVDPVSIVTNSTNGIGADGVIITASTASNDPIAQAPLMCRKRGRIILVGVSGLNLSRNDFYKKEISFQVSCSYGPGRYEHEYEGKNLDYPIGFVRWTENRNFQAVLQLMSDGKIKTELLESKTYSFYDAPSFYSNLAENKEDLGVLLKYDTEKIKKDNVLKVRKIERKENDSIVVGLIGAGNFVGHVILPSLKKMKVRIKYINSKNGVTASHKAKKYNIEYITSDYKEILNDEEVNAVFICTPHSSHSFYVKEALRSGKHVFVEKPLALTKEDIEEIGVLHQNMESPCRLLVGFNRRFSPYIVKAKSLLSVMEAKTIVMTINAGSIPPEHWVQDLSEGGGRLVGEACHFIDLMRFLVGHPLVEAKVQFADILSKDSFSIMLKYSDGSLGTINYFTNGHKSFPKERVDIFSGGKNFVIDNFKLLTAYGVSKFSKFKTGSQDKGHYNEIETFLKSIKDKSVIDPIDLSEIIETSLVSIKLANELNS